MRPPAPFHDTAPRQRLIEIAGEVFAEQGFRSATIRDICARAGANLAAVNYHFGDKESLYLAVLEHAHETALARYPPDLGTTPDSTAEERLRAFIRSFLLRLLDDGVPAWLGKLMAREMIEPTAALDGLVERVMRPLFTRLVAIVGDLAGEGADPERVRLCAQSVVGQCIFYRHAQECLRRLGPDAVCGRDKIEAIADHVMRFSLTAIRDLSGEEGAEHSGEHERAPRGKMGGKR
jgi:AcrR family transcriptional regulator